MKSTAKMLAETWLSLSPTSGYLAESHPEEGPLNDGQLSDLVTTPDGDYITGVTRHDSTATNTRIEDRLQSDYTYVQTPGKPT